MCKLRHLRAKRKYYYTDIKKKLSVTGYKYFPVFGISNNKKKKIDDTCVVILGNYSLMVAIIYLYMDEMMFV